MPSLSNSIATHVFGNMPLKFENYKDIYKSKQSKRKHVDESSKIKDGHIYNPINSKAACTLCSVQCAVCSVHCALCTVQCAVYQRNL